MEETLDNIASLKHERKVLRSKLTKFQNFVNKSGAAETIQIETRLKVIEQERNQFDKCQTKLEFLDASQEDERDITETAYYDAICDALKLLKFQASSVKSTNVSSYNNNSTTITTSRLPELGLPNFYGTYETWLGFLDLFNSIIDNRTDLCDTQKFVYLKTCCKGEAEECLKDLEPSDDNYAIGLNKLKLRFDNKRAIINNHVNKLLFNLPELNKNDSKSLRALIDSVEQHRNALRKLNLPTDQWDVLIIALIVKKLDVNLRSEWENKLDQNNLPTYLKLYEFLVKKCVVFETLKSDVESVNKNASKLNTVTSNSRTFNKFSNFSNPGKIQQCYFTSQSDYCVLCKDNHLIYSCSQFLQMSIKEKYNVIKELNLCGNCLKKGHYKYQCQSGHCKKCNFKHNTLLHDDNFIKNLNSTKEVIAQVSNVKTPQELIVPSESTNVNPNNDQIVSKNFVGKLCNSVDNQVQVLLSTANVLIKNNIGNYLECVALLDSGSQSNFICETMLRKLNIKKQFSNVVLSGINQISTNINSKVRTTIKSLYNDSQYELEFLVVPIITENLPTIPFSTNMLNIPDYVQLADKNFNKPKNIDLLLGVDIFYELLCTGKLKLGKYQPSLQETMLGWIVSGTLMQAIPKRKNERVICNFSRKIEYDQLNESLQKFWYMEEIPENKILSEEEKFCEEYFKTTTYRNETGRFVVRLPIKEESKNLLGDSKETCLQRCIRMEGRLRKNPKVKEQYIQFLQEYEDLKHMSTKNEARMDNNNTYFIPHHPIIRENAITTKLRVVFDASFKTETGLSLNDIMCLGPTIQDELFSIVLRFRLRSVVLNSDVKMMYRQILVNPLDRSYQKILWRKQENETFQEYFLNTVTYGTKSAPYLATRCLKQLATDNYENYPRTCKIIENSFYMDDLILSVDTMEEALEIYNELTDLFLSISFELRKWSSNNSSILSHIKKETKIQEPNIIVPFENKEIKALGISWNPVSDSFKFKIELQKTSNNNMTKRIILSMLSQIYDPLGLVSPALIKPKILIQELWKLKLNWDDEVPQEVKEKWLIFQSQVECLNELQIKRQVLLNSYKNVQLFGFCDASMRAYGAAIYICSEDNQGKRIVNLLCSKSRVAPIKNLTMPKLELLAAYVLAKLVNTVKKILDITISKVTLFSDSTIVLSWLRKDPGLLQIFVGNRVSYITNITNIEDWKHVRSELNIADIISRGIDPSELLQAEDWWFGPSFLLESKELPPFNEEIDILELPEIKKTQVNLFCLDIKDFSLFDRYSTLNRLQRVVAYLLRFRDITLKRSKRYFKLLELEELTNSLQSLIMMAQYQVYFKEINQLKSKEPLNSKSLLLSLNPFIDEIGILRVGGRLKQNVELTIDQKHPIILPYKHKLTILIIRAEHLKQLHAGPQNLLTILRQTYWPIKGKMMIKQVLHKCIICFKVKPKPMQFMMGNLPKERITPSRVFSNCAVDFAGPILIKDSVRRKSQLVKTYISVFVCMAVRAVHLELVHDLSTDSFLNAFKRFISRRGKPTNMFSDNGTNFVGAFNHFKELKVLMLNKDHIGLVHDYSVSNNINWHFNPPSSPHMGGFWESVVKSVKYHLRRVVGQTTLTYEEMNTVLIQIEACLNSRPITPLSHDVNDFLPLTPSHFLIGDILTCAPQLNLLKENTNRLTRYNYLQQLLQSFWNRWYREYLTKLQGRTKWQQNSSLLLKKDSLVVLVEENVPPLRWPMARIHDLHPGSDGVVRVVSIKLPSGKIFKRTVAKICLLPIDI